jgi:hypothetical protein
MLDAPMRVVTEVFDLLGEPELLLIYLGVGDGLRIAVALEEGEGSDLHFFLLLAELRSNGVGSEEET